VSIGSLSAISAALSVPDIAMLPASIRIAGAPALTMLA
jgi:hypothetical protein